MLSLKFVLILLPSQNYGNLIFSNRIFTNNWHGIINTSKWCRKLVMKCRAWFMKIFTDRLRRRSSRHWAKHRARETAIHTGIAGCIEWLTSHLWGHGLLIQREAREFKQIRIRKNLKTPGTVSLLLIDTGVNICGFRKHEYRSNGFSCSKKCIALISPTKSKYGTSQNIIMGNKQKVRQTAIQSKKMKVEFQQKHCLISTLVGWNNTQRFGIS